MKKKKKKEKKRARSGLLSISVNLKSDCFFYLEYYWLGKNMQFRAKISEQFAVL